jgi:hypothetical protein
LGQSNCASCASQPQRSVTLQPQLGGETTKSIRNIWWHWEGDFYSCLTNITPCMFWQSCISHVRNMFRPTISAIIRWYYNNINGKIPLSPFIILPFILL